MEKDKNSDRNHRLEKLDKKNIFPAPEGYFESLPGKIADKIHGQEKVSPAHVLWTPAMRYVLSALSVILVLVTGILLFTRNKEELAVKENPVKEQPSAPAVSPPVTRADSVIPDELVKEILEEEKDKVEKNSSKTVPAETEETQEKVAKAEELLAGITPEDIRSYLEVSEAGSPEAEEAVIY